MHQKSKDILLMRHSYDDHSYIDGYNDTPLTARGVDMARAEAESLIFKLEECERSFDLHVSSKRRAVETAEILVESLQKHGLDYSVTIRDGLRELYQGEMRGLENLSHQERVRMLEIGWEIFDRERVRDNDDYKFGTPDIEDVSHLPFLNFIAPPYGESQNELSIRIADSLFEILNSSRDNERIPFILAHRGTIREVLNITHTHNQRKIFIEQDPNIEMAGWRYCELFTTHVSDIDFSLDALARFVRSET